MYMYISCVHSEAAYFSITVLGSFTIVLCRFVYQSIPYMYIYMKKKYTKMYIHEKKTYLVGPDKLHVYCDMYMISVN